MQVYVIAKSCVGTYLIDVSHGGQRHAERAEQQIGDAKRQHERRCGMTTQLGVQRQCDNRDEVSCLSESYTHILTIIYKKNSSVSK